MMYKMFVASLISDEHAALLQPVTLKIS